MRWGWGAISNTSLNQRHVIWCEMSDMRLLASLILLNLMASYRLCDVHHLLGVVSLVLRTNKDYLDPVESWLRWSSYCHISADVSAEAPQVACMHVITTVSMLIGYQNSGSSSWLVDPYRHGLIFGEGAPALAETAAVSYLETWN